MVECISNPSKSLSREGPSTIEQQSVRTLSQRETLYKYKNFRDFCNSSDGVFRNFTILRKVGGSLPVSALQTFQGIISVRLDGNSGLGCSLGSGSGFGY